MPAIRVVVVLPQPWREFVASMIRSDDRIELVAAYDAHLDPLGAARTVDADFLITLEGSVDALDRGTRPSVVLVEEDGRNGRLLRFLPQSEQIDPLSAERLVASLTAPSIA